MIRPITQKNRTESDLIVQQTYLRGPLTINDLDNTLENVMTWVNDPEVTKNFDKFDHVFTRDEEHEYLEKLLTSFNDRVFAIENENHKYVGQISINQIYWPARHGRLGTVIGNKNEWNKGHAKRANGQILEVAFNELKLNKIWAIFYETNQKIRHICETLGYVKEGLLVDEYYHNGKYHNMVRMAITKKIWEETK